MTATDLIKFCDPARPHIAQPFTIGEYTYATNGRVAVRVPKIEEVPENPKAPKTIPRLVENAAAFNGETFPMPLLPPPDLETCKHCEGFGRFNTCPQCDGSGDVECNLGHYHKCELCDGDGIRADIGGTNQCEYCDGLGKVEKHTRINLGACSFSGVYLRPLAQLPGAIAICPNYTNPAAVTFDGGHAIIMPMR